MRLCIILGLSGCLAALASPTIAAEAAVKVENDYAAIGVDAAGQNLRFLDRSSGVNYCRAGSPGPFSRVKIGGQAFAATEAASEGEQVTLRFGASGASAVLKIEARPRYFVVEVLATSGGAIEELAFVDLPLTPRGAEDEPFAACALALNLQTRVRGIPQASSHLGAACYPRFGLAGAKVALIGCPYRELRNVMQEVVTAAEDLPHSPIGGPWALDGPDNYGS